MKENTKWLCIIVPILVTIIGNILYNRYGSKVKNRVFAIVCVATVLIILIGISYLLIKRYYILSLACLCAVIPGIIIIMGLYTENTNLVIIGTVLIIIVLIVMYVFLKLYVKNKNK